MQDYRPPMASYIGAISRSRFIVAMALLLFLFLSVSPPAGLTAEHTSELQPLGIAMEGYEYPFPVRYLYLKIEGQDSRMAYMDVKPANDPNGRTVVLMHGKNFFGGYWTDTIRFLSRHGFRVVVPDQVGFGKSSKPDIYYTFHLLARNTKHLLDKLNIDRATVVGHSMGGMLAARFALMYPQTTTHLVFENAIGLEDYRLKVPFKTTEQVYQSVLGSTQASIREYHKAYYVHWKREYEDYVQVHYRWTLSGEYPRLAWASALTYQMVYTQPVVYEFPAIQAPTLVVIGQEDRTTLGAGELPPRMLATLGRYPNLGKKTAAALPHAKLVEMENVGHVPHLEAHRRFHADLLKFIETTP
jgi:pimeloyl-ACP methyl ester carboxylesterase